MTAADGDNRIVLRCGIVDGVDPDAWTFRVRFVDNEAPSEDIPVGGSYVSIRGGGWMGAIPEKGDMVLLAKPFGSMDYIPVAYVPYPDIFDTEGDGSGDELLPRNTYKSGRPNVLPGTVGMKGPTGGHVIVRPGGNIELYVDKFCRQLFFSSEKTIHTICQNFILEGMFGVERYFTVREEGRDLEDQTPVGKEGQYKVLAQNAPVIYETHGAVMEEEGLSTTGYPSISNTLFGKGICYRMMVFEQHIADQEAAAGVVPPNPNRASYIVRITQAGNVQIQAKGALFQEWRDRTSAIYGRDVTVANSIEQTATTGAFCAKAETLATLEGKKRVTIKTSGMAYYQAREHRFVSKGFYGDVQGAVKWSVRDAFNIDAGGAGLLVFGGDVSLTSGGSMSQVVSGRYSMTVSGADALENAGRDVISHKTTVKTGKYQVNVQTGSLELSMGKTPTGVALAQLIFHGDVVRGAPYLGRVTLRSLLASLTLDPTGAFELTGVNGSIVANAAGFVQIGPKAGVGGYVITTFSHKDYVTGLPLMGNPQVIATQQGPGIPLPTPAPPVIGPVPPFIPLPDDVEFI